eukprot:1004952-Pelagomonas_calceolata.AAC.1
MGKNKDLDWDDVTIIEQMAKRDGPPALCIRVGEGHQIIRHALQPSNMHIGVLLLQGIALRAFQILQNGKYALIHH